MFLFLKLVQEFVRRYKQFAEGVLKTILRILEEVLGIFNEVEGVHEGGSHD